MNKEKQALLDRLAESEAVFAIYYSEKDGNVMGSHALAMVPPPKDEDDLKKKYFTIVETMLRASDSDDSVEGQILNQFFRSKFARMQQQLMETKGDA